MKTALIIGGGFGGLTTGALLTREGYRVRVLEKNANIGGGLQSFSRAGINFETGMHILGGFNHDGCVRRIFEYIGIMDKLHIRQCDLDCMDEITYLRPNATYRIPQGRAAFTEALCTYFPDEADGIRRYVQACFDITEEIKIFYLHPTNNIFATYSPAFMQPADEFIATFVTDPRLRELLAYMNPMYGGIAGHTPAYIHAIINVLYVSGQYHFSGSSQHMADLLADVIREGGGEVLTRQRVTAINVADRQITAVHTADGSSFTADAYISAIHIKTLFQFLPQGALSKAYITRLTEAPVPYSAFILYLVFHPGTFPYINHTGYILEDFGHMWHLADYDPATWPQGLMYLTPPTDDQGPWAQRMTVNCVMHFDEVARWKDTTTGRRGPDYEAWKRQQAERIIARLEQRFPDIRRCIRTYYTASPLTIRDYYAAPEGSLYGYTKDAYNTARTVVAPQTRISNLFLTGQCVNLHGICGVPLTAINTVEAICGLNTIINKINK